MATDTEVFKDLLLSKFATALGNADARTEVLKGVFYDVYTINKTAADAMASTTTAETLGSFFRYDGIVRAAYIMTDADVTPHADNHATITLSKRDAAGANKTTLATITSDADTNAAWVEFVRETFTLGTASNLTVVEGGALTFEIAKGGTGVVVPISLIQLIVERT